MRYSRPGAAATKDRYGAIAQSTHFLGSDFSVSAVAARWRSVPFLECAAAWRRFSEMSFPAAVCVSRRRAPSSRCACSIQRGSLLAMMVTSFDGAGACHTPARNCRISDSRRMDPLAYALLAALAALRLRPARRALRFLGRRRRHRLCAAFAFHARILAGGRLRIDFRHCLLAYACLRFRDHVLTSDGA